MAEIPKMPPQITLGEGLRGMPYKNRIEGANEFERWMMNNDPEYRAICTQLPGGLPPVERLLVVLSVMSSKAWHYRNLCEALAERLPPEPLKLEMGPQGTQGVQGPPLLRRLPK